MCGVTRLLIPSAGSGRSHVPLYRAGREVAVAAVTGGEEPIARPFHDRVLTEHREEDRREHDVAVLPAFSVAHMDLACAR